MKKKNVKISHLLFEIGDYTTLDFNSWLLNQVSFHASCQSFSFSLCASESNRRMYILLVVLMLVFHFWNLTTAAYCQRFVFNLLLFQFPSRKQNNWFLIAPWHLNGNLYRKNSNGIIRICMESTGGVDHTFHHRFVNYTNIWTTSTLLLNQKTTNWLDLKFGNWRCIALISNLIIAAHSGHCSWNVESLNSSVSRNV